MCFSATASFIAGTLLTAAGAVAVRKNKKSNQLGFAAIPMLFGVQQLSEGFLWLALTREEYAHWMSYPVFIFIFIAQVLWPAWVPWSIRKMEKNTSRRKWLLPLVWLGAVVSAYHCIGLIFFFKVEASVMGNHILYTFNHPMHLAKYSGLFYVIPTIIPPFFSSHRFMWLLGGLIALSLAVSAVFFGEVVLSVWCYFAAAMSAVVFLVLKYNPQPRQD